MNRTHTTTPRLLAGFFMAVILSGCLQTNSPQPVVSQTMQSNTTKGDRLIDNNPDAPSVRLKKGQTPQEWVDEPTSPLTRKARWDALANQNVPGFGIGSRQQRCYADFIDDHETMVSVALKGGADTLYYVIAPNVPEKAHPWIVETMQTVDRIIGPSVVQSDGDPQVVFKMGNTHGRAAEARYDGSVVLSPAALTNNSENKLHGPRTIAHEVGHILGLSHPGKNPDGDRPNDWHTTGSDTAAPGFWRDGLNTHSDHRVVRPDGKSPLDDHDTLMAFLTHTSALDGTIFKWMDVLALRQMYGADQAMPGVRHFDGTNGRCE